MKKLIFVAAVTALVIVNLNLVFSSEKSLIDLSLEGIEALANGESYTCSMCGYDAMNCNCEAGITCPHPDCWSKSCHYTIGNFVCWCNFNGDPYSFCI